MSAKFQLINHLGAYADEMQKIYEVLLKLELMIAEDHGLAPVEVKFIPSATVPDPGYIAHGAFLTPDAAGALGYHDLDSRGMPYAKSFLNVVPGKVLLHDPSGHGGSLAGVITHEYVETRLDLFANLWAQGRIVNPAKKKQTFGLVAYELADPVQDNAFQLQSKDGTSVDCSDYVKPNYFNPNTPASESTSHTGAVRGPMTVAPGGYLIVARQRGETQIFGRRFGGSKEHRLFHPEVPPPAWREAMRTSKFSRANRRLASAK